MSTGDTGSPTNNAASAPVSDTTRATVSGTPQATASGTPQATASGTPQATASGTPRATASGTTPATPEAPRVLVGNPDPAAIAAAAESVARSSVTRQSAAARRSVTIVKAQEVDDADRKKIHDLFSQEDFDKLLQDAANKIVMIEFYAQWCGSCKMIAQRLRELAEMYVDKAIIARIDVDDCEEIAAHYEIASVPAFLYMKNKQKLTIVVGSNQAKIEEMLENLVKGGSVPLVASSTVATVGAPTAGHS